MRAHSAAPPVAAPDCAGHYNWEELFWGNTRCAVLSVGDIVFASAYFDFELIASHTPGRENGVADALSCNALPSFFSQIPNAAHTPSPVPVDLQLGLSTAQPD